MGRGNECNSGVEGENNQLHNDEGGWRVVFAPKEPEVGVCQQGPRARALSNNMHNDSFQHGKLWG
eukprot:8993192-Prorocentrum_lima.AAC.1